MRPRNPQHRNFSYTADDQLSPTGLESKYRANIRAMQTLRFLEREGRKATPQEKKILAAYSGWGAIKEAFNDVQAKCRTAPSYFRDAEYDSWEKNWGTKFNELKALLAPDEWTAAQASTINAHYTPPIVVEAAWKVAQRLGFKGGPVSEPACGTGNFIGMMPPELLETSRVQGTELDPLTARIARVLYPEAHIYEMGYEASPISRGSIALAVGNVPFGQTGPLDSSLPMGFNLHNYFFAKTLDHLAPGGVLIYVTSAYTMDAMADSQAKQRRYLAERSELIGAIRLPNNAFVDNAGTEVVTDILILRKPDGHKLPEHHHWSIAKPLEASDEGDPPRVNEYFLAHPEMVLGKHSLTGSMYRGNSYTVLPDKTSPLRDQLSAAVARLPQGIFSTLEVASIGESDAARALETDKEMSYVHRDGQFFQVTERKLIPVAAWSARQRDIAADFIELREAYKGLMSSELRGANDEDLAPLRRTLNETYEVYSENYGALNMPGAAARFLADDPEYEMVRALERVKEVEQDNGEKTRLYEKAQIFDRRTLTAATEPTEADNIEDAINISLSWHGCVDINYVTHLLGKPLSESQLVADMAVATGRVYVNPETNQTESTEQYLSGNIRSKISAAKRAAEVEPDRFSRNVAALEAVMPEWIPVENIGISLGAAWIPADVITAFARETLEVRNLKITYGKAADRWSVEGSSSSAENTSIYGTDRMHGTDIVESLLNMKTLACFNVGKDSSGKEIRTYDAVASELVNQKAKQLQEEFSKWAKTTEQKIFSRTGEPTVRAILEEAFNQRFNSHVFPTFSGGHLALPGLSNAVKRNDHQLAAVWRNLQERQGVNAHGVGFGKTYTQVISAMELKRLGIAKKPMIVVDNATIGQFAESFRVAYPHANILVATEDTFKTANRRRFLAAIATGDWDAVIVAQSQFNLLPSDPASVDRYLSVQIDELDLALYDARKSGDRVSTKMIVQAKTALEKRRKSALERIESRQDNMLNFEQLGVDFLFVDECHRYKKAPFVTKMDRVKGLDTSTSDRGMNLHIKLQHIQSAHGGKNAIGLSGTPITNTLTEAWTQMRLFAPNLVAECDIETFDRFASTFTKKVTAMELNESNGRFKLETRLSSFTNGPEFVKFIRSGWDVQMDSEKVGLNVPALKGGEVKQVIVPLAPQNAEINAMLASIYNSWDASDKKNEATHIPIVLMQVGMAASIDPRLVSSSAVDDPRSLVNACIGNVLADYRASDELKGTQLIFCDRYRRISTASLDDFASGSFSAVTLDEVDGEAIEPDDTAAGEFNLYRDIKAKLVAQGIPEREIAIITDYKKDKDRTALFGQMNEGKVRVLLGSTDKMGVGVNVQRRLVAMHELDVPRDMTPSSMKQRRGRILRQGNLNSEVNIYAYGMENTVAAGLYDRVARKEKFIVQTLMGNGVTSEFDDPASALSISNSEMKAKLTSDKRVVRQVELTEEIRQLATERDGHYANIASVKSSIAATVSNIAKNRDVIGIYERAAAFFQENSRGDKLHCVANKEFQSDDKKAIAAYLDDLMGKMREWHMDRSTTDYQIRLNGVPCAIRMNTSFMDEKRRDFELVAFAPDNPNQTLRVSCITTGEGLVRSFGNCQRFCEDRAVELQNTDGTLTTKLTKLQLQLDGIPKEFGKLEQLRDLRTELDSINMELLQESEEARKQDRDRARGVKSPATPTPPSAEFSSIEFETFGFKFASISDANEWMQVNDIEGCTPTKMDTELYWLEGSIPKGTSLTEPRGWYVMENEPRFTTRLDPDNGFGLSGPYTRDYIHETFGLSSSEIKDAELAVTISALNAPVVEEPDADIGRGDWIEWTARDGSKQTGLVSVVFQIGRIIPGVSLKPAEEYFIEGSAIAVTSANNPRKIAPPEQEEVLLPDAQHPPSVRL